MSPLGFVGDLSTSPLADLLCDNPDVPKRTPGAYILVASSGITFRYPRGESPVFYIGKADRVRHRLLTHRNKIWEAMTQKQSVYGPVGEYGAAFEARYSFIRADDQRTPEELERLLMARFARIYRGLPVANTAADWERLRQIISRESQAEPGSASGV